MFISTWRRWLKQQARTGRRRSKPRSKPSKTSRQPRLEELEARITPTGTWTEVNNLPPDALGAMLLLPNGTVMAQETGVSNTWYQLTPGSSGGVLSYDQGTWGPTSPPAIAAMSSTRLYYGSVVMPSGKVMVYGGEYTNPSKSSVQTEANSGEIYNPVANKWKSVASIPTSLNSSQEFGDQQLLVLPSGKVLAGNSFGTPTGTPAYVYDPSSNSWSLTPAMIDPGVSNSAETASEESWVRLPGTTGNILAYSLWASLDQSQGYGEYYDPAANKWVATGRVPVALSGDGLTSGDNSQTELGPALLMPNGPDGVPEVFQVGANGFKGSGGNPTNTAIYNPATNSWSAGPTIPGGYTADDAPGAVLPDGNVIFAADAGSYTSPTALFEYTPSNNKITQLSIPSSLPSLSSALASDPAFDCRMLVLPNGQVAFADALQQNLWFFSENDPVPSSWQPTISSITDNGGTFTLNGTQLTGMSQGAAYGDDAQMDTNYPLVQLTDGSGNVTFAQTSNWAPGVVETGSAPETTTFQSPPTGAGPYLFSVSASGISSSNLLFVDLGLGADNLTLKLNTAGTALDVFQNGSTSLGEFPLLNGSGQANFTAIDIHGTGAVTLDYSNGAFGVPITDDGLVNGLSSSSNTLTIADSSSLKSLTYDAGDANGDAQSGDLMVNNGVTTDTIDFSGIKGGITDAATVNNLTINVDPHNAYSGLVTTTFTGAGATTTASLTPGVGNPLAPFTFADPAATLAVNGHAGNDHITFTSVGTGFDPALTVAGNAGTNTVDLNAPLTLGSATSSGNLTVTATTINIGANLDAAGGTSPGKVSLTGAVTLTASAGITYGGTNGLVFSGGPLNLQTFTLTATDVAAANTGSIGVQITGNGGLTKAGPGTLTLTSATNNYSGTTTVSAGHLEVDGTITSNVSLTGGTLSGKGTTGTVTGSSGGVAPGQGSTPDILTTGALSLQAGSNFTIPVGGNTAGNGTAFYAQDVVSSGTITLGATLNFAKAGGYVPQNGDEYFIIDNKGGSPITTQFLAGAGCDLVSAGTTLTEGMSLSLDFLGSTWRASITYQATDNGDPNSVAIIITPVDVAPSITSPASATFTVGTASTFTVTTSGYPAPSLSIGSFTMPSGLTFQDQGNGTATISGNANVGGAFTFTITAQNGFGSPATQIFSLTVDQVANITSAASATFTVGTAKTFTVQTLGFPVPSFSDNGYKLPSGLTFTDNHDGTATLAGNAALGTGGTYTFTITAHNGVGSDAMQTFTLTVNEAPSFKTAPGATFTVGVPGSFTVQTRGYPAPTLSDSNDALLASLGLTFTDQGSGTATLAGTPGAGTGGGYTFTITAQNSVSTTTQTFNLTIGQPAGITSANSATFTVGTASTFSVTMSGFPAPTLSDGGYTLPSGLSLTNQGNGIATLAGNAAPGAGGTYTFTLTAHNGIGADATQTFTLTVDEAPTIKSNPGATFTVGITSTFTVTTTGYPVPTLSDSNDALLGSLGLTFTGQSNGTATLAGTPGSSTGGTYTFTITAHNGIGSDAKQTFTLTIDQPAAITSAAGATFTVGATSTFTVNTTGFPAATLSDGGYNLPSGLSLANQGNGSALLSGNAGSGTGGTYTFTITAHNGVGSDATQTFTLTVDEAPSITSMANASFIVGTAGSFTITTKGFPAPTLSDNSFALPTGLTFTPLSNGTATITGTPATGTQKLYTFTLTAHNGIGSDVNQTFNLLVGIAPSFTSPNNAAFTAGTSGTFTATASGFPAPTISISGQPAWVSLTGGVLNISPPATSAGVYGFTLSAMNGIGSPATQTFTLTINAPISFSPAPAALPPGVLNASYSQTITALGGTGTKILTYPAPANTLGLSITPSTNSITISGNPTALGTFTINITATDAAKATAFGSFTIRIVSVALVPDFLSPGLTMLVVGTPASDALGTAIQPVDSNGDLSVFFNGSTTPTGILVNGAMQPTARPTGHILVYGNNSGGKDAVRLKAAAVPITVPAFLIGGKSNETLDASGSNANNVLVGGNGTNSLKGGSGRDILIGGPNYGVLQGGSNQDILLSGTTSYALNYAGAYTNIAALNALMAEWANSTESIATRETNLQNGGGANGATVLNVNTVQTDVPAELIEPGSSQNWLINTPMLIGTNESSGQLTFSWGTVNGATTYKLLLVDETTGKTVGTYTVTPTSPPTFVRSTSGLTVGHTYRWWITPVSGTQSGLTSSPLNFVLT